MDHLGGENIHNLRQHILDELIDFRIAYTEHILIDTPIVPHLIGTACATQFRITRQSSQHVSGHIDLGDDGDMTLGSIADNLTGLSLGVETTVGDVVVKVGIGADDGARTLRTNLRKLRPFLNLDAPTLIVGEMPVENVHIMERQQVNELLHEVDGPEMAGAVEMHPSPGESRGVGDFDGRKDLTIDYRVWAHSE